VRFLENYGQSEPFFLKVSFARPHSPYDPPQRFFDMYKDASLPTARVGKWAERYAQRNSDRWDIWRGDLGAAQVRESRQGYYGSVSFIDEQIGRILESLEKRRLLDNTLIIYTSDHGDMTGDQNLWRKSYAYEPSARVPMLMRGPGVKRGVRNEVVELRDVLPTLLDAAGVQPSRALDGRSLLRLEEWRSFIDLEHDICYSPENHWNALTDGRKKYIFHARDGEEQLFDLTKDPHELNDLAGNTADATELRKWRVRLTEHFAERGAPFLISGRLGLRPERLLYSPNYPRAAAQRA
jgi:arylsulfatase